MKATKRAVATLALTALFGLTSAGVCSADDEQRRGNSHKVQVHVGNYAGQHQRRASARDAFQFRGRGDSRYSGYRFRPIDDFAKRDELSAGASAFPQLRITF